MLSGLGKFQYRHWWSQDKMNIFLCFEVVRTMEHRGITLGWNISSATSCFYQPGQFHTALWVLGLSSSHRRKPQVISFQAYLLCEINLPLSCQTLKSSLTTKSYLSTLIFSPLPLNQRKTWCSASVLNSFNKGISFFLHVLSSFK